MSTPTDDSIRKISECLGKLLAWFGVQCLRAWLLSLSVPLFFPSVALGFWEWVLVVLTVRFLFAKSTSES